MAGRVVVADGDDRPRQRFDFLRADISDHDPILFHSDPLLKAGLRRLPMLGLPQRQSRAGQAWAKR
jgi:hypothetical protein